MGLNGNNSNESVVVDAKLYTGIQLALIKGICPNMAKLKELGFNVENEPVYIQPEDDKGNKRVAIDFYLKFKDVDRIQKLRFFLTNTPRLSNDGIKRELIDITGKTCWDTLEGKGEAYDWFDSETARPCLVGEGILTNFLINWLNIKPGDNARLDDPSKLFDMDLKELNKAFEDYPDNKVRAMLVIKPGEGGKTYQNVYSQYFDRATNTSFTYWEKHINKRIADGRAPQEEYSYDFKEYTPIAPTPETTDAGTTTPSTDDDF